MRAPAWPQTPTPRARCGQSQSARASAVVDELDVAVELAVVDGAEAAAVDGALARLVARVVAQVAEEPRVVAEGLALARAALPAAHKVRARERVRLQVRREHRQHAERQVAALPAALVQARRAAAPVLRPAEAAQAARTAPCRAAPVHALRVRAPVPLLRRDLESSCFSLRNCLLLLLLLLCLLLCLLLDWCATLKCIKLLLLLLWEQWERGWCRNATGAADALLAFLEGAVLEHGDGLLVELGRAEAGRDARERRELLWRGRDHRRLRDRECRAHERVDALCPLLLRPCRWHHRNRAQYFSTSIFCCCCCGCCCCLC